MSLPVKKIITASAGTGKTYRLSLEFLGLIYLYNSFQEFTYDQILVITFTKKATAEIRERIYSHLYALGNKENDWRELAVNLKETVLKQAVTDRENPLSDSEVRLFYLAWQYLSAHRDELQVMTIDSYVHGIFRNLIRPARGIDSFEIDPEAITKRLPALFEAIISEALSDSIQTFLARHMRPSLDEFSGFFTGLIQNRWLHYLVSTSSESMNPDSLAGYSMRPLVWQTKAQEHRQAFLTVFTDLIAKLSAHLALQKTEKKPKSEDIANYLKADFARLFRNLPDQLSELPQLMEEQLQEDNFARKLLSFMNKEDSFWKNIQQKDNEIMTDWKSGFTAMKKHLADYLVFRLFLPEQKEILDFWKSVLEQYDRLVFRYKSFTYDDVSWLTFEGLHSAYPPLFKAETDDQPNEFYEFISHRTRFILIDEFQDTSILQFRIFKPMIEELLSGIGILPYGGIIVVGDEKQSIFGWRGGQRSLLLDLEHLIQPQMPAEKASLTSSWRSTPLLMQAVNAVFTDRSLHAYLDGLGMHWSYRDEVQGMNLKQAGQSYLSFRLQNLSESAAGGGPISSLREFIEQRVIPFWRDPHRPEGSVAILARTNIELERIRYLLGESDIPCEYQSSNALTEHPVIKAMLYLLRFTVYRDWYDFLSFLRSDLVLLDAKPLRRVIDIIADWQKQPVEERSEPDFKSVPSAQAAYELALSLQPRAVWQSCLSIIKTCAVQERLTHQRDFANVQKFLDLSLAYENTVRSDLPELQGFLRFCEDNVKQEMLQQQDVESSSAIQLLTIHKSKGLEFDTVFVCCNLQRNARQDSLRLSSWVQYGDPGFSRFSDYAFTMHYDNILAQSSFSTLMQEENKRAELEELNSLYVAVTRARARLIFHAAYRYKEGWEKSWETRQKENNLTLPHFVVAAFRQFMEQEAVLQSDGSYLLRKQVLPVSTQSEVMPQSLSEESSCTDLRSILPDLQPEKPEPLPDYRPELDWKRSFLVDRDNLKGNIVHYYLSRLKYAERQELEQARTLTLLQYGNLLPRTGLEAVINAVESRLPALKDIFDPRYDIVFTEYPIYYKGREYRPDRLMLDTQAKSCCIIDFKTGQVYDQEQINIYKSVLRAILPADYTIAEDSRFLSIDL
jgi:ATP-dependent exoDNAse (exonuclease V) beta subunit